MSCTTLLRYDVLMAWRALNARIGRHPFLTTLVILSVLALLIILAIAVSSTENVLLERWQLILIVFAMITARSAIYTYRRFLKEMELRTILVLPVSRGEILAEKFLLVSVFIFSLLLTGYVVVEVVLIAVRPLGITGIHPSMIAEWLILTLIAVCLGFSIPIKMQIRPIRWTAIYILPDISIIIQIYFLLRIQTQFLPSQIYMSLLLLPLGIALANLLLLPPLIYEAWWRQAYRIQKEMSLPRRRLKLPNYLMPRDEGTRRLVKKELLIILREKDNLGNILASAGITVLLIVLAANDPFTALGPAARVYSKYVLPLLIGFSLYITALLTSCLMSLSMIGIEGKRLWILKSLPVRSMTVIRSKVMAVLMLAIPLNMAVALPVPILASFPSHVIVFYLVEALVFSLSFSGLGIWAATVFPNFSEADRGIPDILIQLLLTVVSFFLSIPLAGIPAILLARNYLLGLAASLTALLWSFVILMLGIRRASRRYDLIDLASYASPV